MSASQNIKCKDFNTPDYINKYAVEEQDFITAYLDIINVCLYGLFDIQDSQNQDIANALKMYATNTLFAEHGINIPTS